MTAVVDDRPDEIAALEARVAQLEAELALQARATNELVARAQEKLYWLERWHVDLDQVMARRGAQQLLEVTKRGRTVLRAVRRTKRRLSG
ncbi:hypothetical protein NBH00_02455 [Paraconexibacter antarcticus]|uniref:Uncharacterized protein n=1 Tax=Paraconexibacter antarcticus TaxID=2949664 RepID=A0ABY5DUB8_9ACTN|nr:hypothetical protein [Paraconexibacter antarcticus]UTI65080.1 hypothetical protein NBH00_02455 [Paraconexibacter antarcticus]